MYRRCCFSAGRGGCYEKKASKDKARGMAVLTIVGGDVGVDGREKVISGPCAVIGGERVVSVDGCGCLVGCVVNCEWGRRCRKVVKGVAGSARVGARESVGNQSQDGEDQPCVLLLVTFASYEH